MMVNEGYVYVARIIDHGGKFVGGYHKIGLSKHYKIRETQLNSTHLPFDVLMIRVFQTSDMKTLEGILHTCFEDYRVIKEYNDRKNITTEWFDVGNIDTFNDRLDKMSNYLNLDEIDLGLSIESDNTLTQSEKEGIKEQIKKSYGDGIKHVNEWSDILEKKGIYTNNFYSNGRYLSLSLENPAPRTSTQIHFGRNPERMGIKLSGNLYKKDEFKWIVDNVDGVVDKLNAALPGLEFESSGSSDKNFIFSFNQLDLSEENVSLLLKVYNTFKEIVSFV
jgi:hypothetical protein